MLRYKRLYMDSFELSAPVEGNAGYDLPAYEGKLLLRDIPTDFGTGIAVEIPNGYVGLIFGRSGNAFKRNITVYHHGVIDSSYRGEIRVKLLNMGQDLMIQPGDKIAQLVIVPVFDSQTIEVDDLSETSRGVDGFGSTGLVGALLSELQSIKKG